MKVDFLVFFTKASDLHLYDLIVESLKSAYEDNYDEPPSVEELDMAIDIRYVKDHFKQHIEPEHEQGETFIGGFSVDFVPEEVDVGNEIVKAFCKELINKGEKGIQHLLKFKDPYLKMRNSKYADEIFDIEMKLREVLSLIFMDTYGDNFYNLLKDVSVKPTEDKLQPEQMQTHLENEFFYLLFSHYPNLNIRKQPNTPKDLIHLIGQADGYEVFKQMLISKPIKNEQYAGFLASLQTRVDPIEKLRNCVAHNRTVPQRVIEDYETAKEPLLKSIDDMLSKKSEDNHRMFWEEEVCEALKAALKTARWNIEDSSVKIYNSHDDRDCTCHTYDELVDELHRLATDTASVYMPFDGGEPVFDYEPYDDVADVLAEYEEQIRELGWDI